jgi:hypothetical protein
MSALRSLLLGVGLIACIVVPALAPVGVAYLVYVFVRDLKPGHGA